MLNKIKEFFTGKKPESNYAHPLDAVTTPYKVEPPVTGTYDVPPAPGVTTLLYVPPAAEPAPAVVEAAPEQKARKPRAPKAAPVAVVKEKAPAKAKAPKATKSKKV
jgi:hypothetical protein